MSTNATLATFTGFRYLDLSGTFFDVLISTIRLSTIFRRRI